VPTLRPWSTKSSEQKWAIAIASGCFVILIILPFWPEGHHNSEDKLAKVEKTAVPIKQAPPVSTQKLPPKKVSTKAIVSHAKQETKKALISVKPHVAPIQITKKTITSHSSKAYFVQVGAFQDKAHAQKLKKQLLKKHWSAIIQKKNRFYAVQVGPYQQREKANSIKKQLSHKEKINGFITHHAYP
jgi:cell division septation protein DedD